MSFAAITMRRQINWTSRFVIPYGLPSQSSFDFLARTGFCTVEELDDGTLQPGDLRSVVTVIQLPSSSEFPLNSYQPGTATILQTVEGDEEFSQKMEISSDEMRAVCNLTGLEQRLALCKSTPMARA